jgi:hypothetical protein
MSKRKANTLKKGNYRKTGWGKKGGSQMVIEYGGRSRTILLIEPGKDWVDITPETQQYIEGVGSTGFASCFLFVCKTPDNSYISLEHSQLCDVADIAYALNKKASSIAEKSGKEVQIFLGLDKKSFKEELLDEQRRGEGKRKRRKKDEGENNAENEENNGEDESEENKQDAEELEESFAARYKEHLEILQDIHKEMEDEMHVVEMTDASALIFRDGVLILDVPEQILQNAREPSEQKTQDSKSGSSSSQEISGAQSNSASNSSNSSEGKFSFQSFGDLPTTLDIPTGSAQVNPQPQPQGAEKLSPKNSQSKS